MSEPDSRRDFDHVEFGDYQRDMDELGQLAANVAEHQRCEIVKLKNIITALVQAAGGKITVSRRAIIARHGIDNLELIQSWNAHDDAIDFVVREKREGKRK